MGGLRENPEHWSTTLPTITLSSTGSELLALVKGGIEALGARNFLADVGARCEVVLGVDVAPTIAVVLRTGVGRVRRLDVRYLWIHERIRSGEFQVYKVFWDGEPGRLDD